MPSETDISGIRCYDKVVDDVTYKVPRGITREARCGVWIVRVLKNNQLLVSARFTDLRFGDTGLALNAAIIHLLHSGHAWLNYDVLRLDERAVVHWRKRSGVGLCAVAYVISKRPGRGETLFLSTYKRVASGRGMEKFRGKLIEVLEVSYKLSSDESSAPYAMQKKMRADIHHLLNSQDFQAFLAAGKRKADQIVVDQYLD
ncbi:MAG: hypothetical protein ACOH2R_22110 [Pseudomonas sp.]